MSKNITVKDILNTPEFYDFKVIAGKSALNKKVSSITIMDAPDPFPWAKGGEIVLSSGYVFKIHFDEFQNIIMKLHRAGIVALFIKVKRFFGQLPEEIIHLADEIGFPIIEVPNRIAFTEFINPALSKIIDLQSEVLKTSEKIHTTFTNLVINNEDTQSIINILSDLLNEDIFYYDIHFQRTYYSNRIEMIPQELKYLDLKEILNKYHYYAIGINKEVYGYIIYLKLKEEEIENDDYNILSHANTALILDVQKKIASMQIEDRHKNEFVQDIIMNNIKFKEEVNKRAEIYGWNFSGPICAMVVDIDNFKAQYLKLGNKKSNEELEFIREQFIKNTTKIIKSYFKDAVYATFSDRIVFLLQPNDRDIKSVDSKLKKSMEDIRKSTHEKFQFTVTLGIGDFKDDIMDVHKSYGEALTSIKIGRVLYKKNSIVFYGELGVFKLLYSVYENEEVKEFCISSIGKIIEHDEKYNSELLKTLLIILENDWNLKSAADKMFIHYNTMKYRYKKICSILNEDLNEYEVRLKLSLALKIYQMTN